jgi:glycerophosphoryl diester phosphodiesterase
MRKLILFSIYLCLLVTSLSQEEIREEPSENNGNTIVEGHRGGMGISPQNTLKAFSKCIELGCDSSELDIWLTKDKQIVVVHGGSHGELEHYTQNCTGRVPDKYYWEIQYCNVGEGERIPLLLEVFQLCRDKMWINIEIKSNNRPEILDLLWEMIVEQHFVEQCGVSSFNFGMMEDFYILSQGRIKRGYIYGSSVKKYDIEYVATHGTSANIGFSYLTKELCDAIHAEGHEVMTWANVSPEESHYQNLIDMGADILCVNYPDKLIEYLKITDQKPEDYTLLRKRD